MLPVRRSVTWNLASIVTALVVTRLDVAAQAILAGPDFRINTETTSAQFLPAVAADGAGNFIVVWESNPQDGSGSGVFGQRYDGTGALLGPEFQVNTHTSFDQRLARVAADAAGNFVVAWQSYGQDGHNYGIFARRYDSSGAPQGTEFQVNTYTTDYQVHPVVASDATGNFVVVWHSGTFSSVGQDGNSWGVFGQRYDNTGAAQGAEFQVNTYTTGSQLAPAVASDAAGNFVVVWSGPGPDNDDVFGRRYNSGGVPQGVEFQVNTYTTSSQTVPAVAADAVGNLVVTWQSYGQDGSSWGVFGQRYDGSGAAQGPEFQVNTFTTSAQEQPSVGLDPAGTFLVVWESVHQDGSTWGIFGRRFDPAGTPLGPDFQVNSYASGYQTFPAVAADTAGNFLAAWSGPGASDDEGIFARRYGVRVPVSGKRLLIKDTNVTRRFITFRSLDPLVSTAGDGMNPLLNGAFLHVYNPANGDSACMPLPVAGWTASGSPPTYRYRDVDFMHGPCGLALLRHGRLIKAVCRATVQPITYSLDEPQQGTVSVDFRSGTASYCAVFGGTILTDSSAAQRFHAKNAPAASVCPTPPVSCP